MKHEPKPIADGPLWPWVKVVDELATELGRVVDRRDGPLGFERHVRARAEPRRSPGETHATYRWVSVDASVSTPAELIPVLRQLLASAAKPTPEYIAKLERIRSEIK